MEEKQKPVTRKPIEAADPSVSIERIEKQLARCFSYREPAIVADGQSSASDDNGAPRFGRLVRFEHFRALEFQNTALELYALIDADTHYVLGLNVASDLHSKTAIRETLWMPMRDKSQIARDAGATLDWSGHCLPDTMSVEPGSPVAHKFITETLPKLNIRHNESPRAQDDVRHPLHWLGRELTEFLHTLPKSTTHAEARLKARDFLIRFVCDQYHHRANERLGGDTPHRAYLVSTAKHAIGVPPQWQTLLAALGNERRRAIGPHGVEFAGMVYTSQELLALRQKGVDVVRLRFDPMDMRAIAFEAKKGMWGTAYSLESLPPDISIDALLAVQEALMQRSSHEVTSQMMNEAIQEVRKAS